MRKREGRAFLGKGPVKVDGISNVSATGMFLLRKCIPPRLRRDVHQSLRSIFRLSNGEKEQFLADKASSPLAAGFSPFGVARALDTGVPNLLETWDLGDHKTKWPPTLRQQYLTLRRYETLLHTLTKAALEELENELGIAPNQLAGLVAGRRRGLHLIHYFPVDRSHDRNAQRQSRHTDNTLVTLIPPTAPSTQGLLIHDRGSGEWLHVRVPADGCVVQVGRLLEFLTNGSLPACLHTVQTPGLYMNANIHRYSTPYFASPAPEVVLQPFPRFIHSATGQDLQKRSVNQLQQDYFQSIFGD